MAIAMNILQGEISRILLKISLTRELAQECSRTRNNEIIMSVRGKIRNRAFQNKNKKLTPKSANENKRGVMRPLSLKFDVVLDSKKAVAPTRGNKTTSGVNCPTTSKKG